MTGTSNKCGKCEYCTNNTRLMKGHMSAKRGKFECNKGCNITFVSNDKLQTHMKSIHAKQCEECKKTFNSTNKLKQLT